MKVIYVSAGHLTRKIQRDWYLDFLIGKGAQVEFWDVVDLVRDPYEEPSRVDASYVRRVESYDQLEEMLRRPENRGTHYVLIVYYDVRSARLFRLMTRHACRMLFMSWGAVPAMQAAPRDRLRSRLAHPFRSAKNAMSRIRASAYRRLGLVKPFDVLFSAGRAAMGQHPAEKIVPINLCDYDQFLRVASEKRLFEGDYAVFLDQNVPFHSDYAVWGWPTIEPQSYYRSLNRYFALVEKKFGIPVVIAAHPQAKYGDEVFQSRKLFSLRTAELVKDAQFVIGHDSIALSYPVLNRKPIIISYTDDMLRTYRHTEMQIIRAAASYLGQEPVNVDSISSPGEIAVPVPNAERYDNYKYDFLTSPESEGLLTQDIFWRELSAKA